MYSFAFLGSKSIVELQSSLQQHALKWKAEWCVHRSLPEVRVAACSAPKLEQVHPFYACTERAGGFFWVVADNVNWLQLVLSDLPIGDFSSKQIKQLSQAAKTDLLAVILGANEPSDFASKPIPAHINAYIKIECSFGDLGSVDVICPQWMWRELYKKSSYKFTNKKLKRDDLVVNSLTDIELAIDFGAQPVELFSDLKKGSLLTFDKSVENLFSLQVGSRKIGAAAVGKIGDRKAFMTLKGNI